MAEPQPSQAYLMPMARPEGTSTICPTSSSGAATTKVSGPSDGQESLREIRKAGWAAVERAPTRMKTNAKKRAGFRADSRDGGDGQHG